MTVEKIAIGKKNIEKGRLWEGIKRGSEEKEEERGRKCERVGKI